MTPEPRKYGYLKVSGRPGNSETAGDSVFGQGHPCHATDAADQVFQ